MGRGSWSWKGTKWLSTSTSSWRARTSRQQQVEALTEQIKSKIASLGGAVTKVEPWGLKSLAFRIKKNRKAHFTLLNIAAPSEAVVEIERLLEHQRGRRPLSHHPRRRT